MSRGKWAGGLLVVLFAATIVGQDGSEKLLRFFWDRAKAATHSGDPATSGLSYSYVATSYYKIYADKGQIASTDSTRVSYFYSFGKLDSSKVALAPKRKFPAVDFGYSNVFDSSYTLNFFPNDTGGKNIAIGFDADSTHATWPVGLVLLDRQKYFPSWLYLSYPDREGYRRFSRMIRFTETNGFLFPDSIVELGIVDRFLSTTSYRLETGLKDLQIHR